MNEGEGMRVRLSCTGVSVIAYGLTVVALFSVVVGVAVSRRWRGRTLVEHRTHFTESLNSFHAECWTPNWPEGGEGGSRSHTARLLDAERRTTLAARRATARTIIKHAAFRRSVT